MYDLWSVLLNVFSIKMQNVATKPIISTSFYMGNLLLLTVFVTPPKQYLLHTNHHKSINNKQVQNKLRLFVPKVYKSLNMMRYAILDRILMIEDVRPSFVCANCYAVSVSLRKLSSHSNVVNFRLIGAEIARKMQR